MSRISNRSRAGLVGALLAAASSLLAPAARASDPLPGEAYAPPANVNILLLYDKFTDAGAFGSTQDSYGQNTHLSNNGLAARYIHTFKTAGLLSGVQLYLPYVMFLGAQKTGVSDLGSLYHGLPSLGAGQANLSHQSGFGQPFVGGFVFPVNEPGPGTFLVLGAWLGIPVSSFNKDDKINPGQNVWTFEAEAGFRKILLGSPQSRNLTLEIWGEAYLYGDNENSAYVTPTISANAFPPIYSTYNRLSNGLIPDSNPLTTSTATQATFHEQPTEELRVYLPWQIYPPTAAFIAPGLYQSFGGKQTYTLRNGQEIDSGNRTNETQLRLVAATFVTPSLNLMAVGAYDVAAHGGPVNRAFEFRIAKFF